MPCKTCGKDCKCLRMMSKRSCGTRSCDSDCTCPCNTASKTRNDPPTKNSQQSENMCDCVSTPGSEETSPAKCDRVC